MVKSAGSVTTSHSLQVKFCASGYLPIELRPLECRSASLRAAPAQPLVLARSGTDIIVASVWHRGRPSSLGVGGAGVVFVVICRSAEMLGVLRSGLDRHASSHAVAGGSRWLFAPGVISRKDV